MKTLFLLILIFSSLIFISNVKANQSENNHREKEKAFYYNEDENNFLVRQNNLGIQLKYLSGIGLSGNLKMTDRMFMTGSVSWLFAIMNFAFGPGFSLSRYFDFMGKLNLIYVESNSSPLLLFPEIVARYKPSKNFYLEAGAIIPFISENRKTLMDYLNVPFIVNAGLVFIIF